MILSFSIPGKLVREGKVLPSSPGAVYHDRISHAVFHLVLQADLALTFWVEPGRTAVQCRFRYLAAIRTISALTSLVGCFSSLQFIFLGALRGTQKVYEIAPSKE